MERHFSAAAKAEVASIVQDPIAVYRQRIQALDWMSETTKARALQSRDEFCETFGITEGDGMWIPQEERVTVWELKESRFSSVLSESEDSLKNIQIVGMFQTLEPQRFEGFSFYKTHSPCVDRKL